jgi:O-antigen/teichoic acid export membrane protein
LPLLPPILVLAPVLLPGVLGQEWKAMVVPFQILVAVGVGHALLVALGDSLSGVGAISWRARLHLVWSLAMIVALVVLVRLEGITGAALAHLLLFVPFALVYVVWGTRQLSTDGRVFLAALRAIVLPVAAQAALTLAALALLERALAPLPAAAGASAAGVVFVFCAFARFTPALAGECRAFVSAFAGRRAERADPSQASSRE